MANLLRCERDIICCSPARSLLLLISFSKSHVKPWGHLPGLLEGVSDVLGCITSDWRRIPLECAILRGVFLTGRSWTSTSLPSPLSNNQSVPISSSSCHRANKFAVLCLSP